MAPRSLFHFLDDTAKPWSKRCDFVVFNLRKSKLHVYCLEFKSESIPHDVPDQLKASVDWLKALHATINAYTTKRSTIHATKYVLSNHQTRRRIWIRMASIYSAITRYATTAMPILMAWH